MRCWAVQHIEVYTQIFDFLLQFGSNFDHASSPPPIRDSIMNQIERAWKENRPAAKERNESMSRGGNSICPTCLKSFSGRMSDKSECDDCQRVERVRT